MIKDATMLPCPFCGCTDLLTEPVGDPDDRWYRVTCVFDGCAADGPLMRNQKDAARAWNARCAVEPTANPQDGPLSSDYRGDALSGKGNVRTEPSAYLQRLAERAKANPVNLDEVGVPHYPEDNPEIARIVSEWTPKPEDDVPCFFCRKQLADHRDNAQGHLWRRGSVVTDIDIAINAENRTGDA